MQKSSPGKFPYDGYLVYGPIFHKKEGRNMVVLVAKDRVRRTSTSYARYMMATHLKRRLLPTEQVDHKNGKAWDDRIGNLQILSPKNNQAKYLRDKNIVRKVCRVKCPHCKTEFTRARNQTHIVKGGYFTACSRQCAYRLKARNYRSNILEEFTVESKVR